MEQKNLDALRHELSIKAKNGLDFITSAAIVWLAIGYLWTLPLSSYNKSIYTFIIGAVMLPLAFALSKVYKTEWKVKNNPLQPLGLWLNFAQLFYFPFLVFILIKSPDHFVMTYVIITGAHFFPYAWFYNEIGYAIAAGIIAWGALLISFTIRLDQMYIIPIFMSVCLLILAIVLNLSYKRKRARAS